MLLELNGGRVGAIVVVDGGAQHVLAQRAAQARPLGVLQTFFVQKELLS